MSANITVYRIRQRKYRSGSSVESLKLLAVTLNVFDYVMYILCFTGVQELG